MSMERWRRATWVDRLMFGLLGIFVIATLGEALVGAVTLLDVNLLTRFASWQALHGQDILTTNIHRGDTVDNVMPAIAEIRSRLFHGDFPGWSPASVGGSPLAGSPNFGEFSPLSLPYYVLPLWFAPAFVKLGEFAVAIGGMTLFLRRLRLSVASGILAGIVFASSGFMISWTNWPQTRVAAFIPALFWATELLVQRQRALDALPMAVVVVSMLLGGFPEVTGMALYCAALYFLVRIVLVHRSRWRTGVWASLLAGLGLILGAALSAVQLLPFFKQLSTINLDYRGQDENSHSTLASLITTMVPDAQGLGVNGVSYGRDNPIENVAFIGVAAIVLAIVAILMRARLVRRTQRGVVGFLGVAVVVVVILGWVGGPLLALAQHFPVFSNNGVSRIRSLLGFLVAALAGFGFERLLGIVRDQDTQDPRHARLSLPESSRFRFASFRTIWSVVVIATAIFFGLWVLNEAVSEARISGGMRRLAYVGVMPVILLALCVASVLAVRSGRRRIRIAAIVAIAVITVGQSASAFKGSVTGSNPDNFYPVTTTHQFLQQNLGAQRFAASGRTIYPATAMYYGLRTPTGHQFTTDAWKELLHAVDPDSLRSPTFSDFGAKAVNAGSVGHIPILDQMAVRYFVAADSDIAGTRIEPPASPTTVTLASDQHAECAPPSGPLRAVTVNLAGPLHGAGQAGATVHVTLHTPRGDLTGARYLGGGLKSPAAISVAIPGEELTTADPVTADVWVSGASGTIPLQGSRTAGTRPALSCGQVVPIHDGLKLVSSAAGAIVYQRLTSLPRIRWASSMAVLTDPAARVARLTAGISPGAVVLNTPGPAASGESAKVHVTTDDGDTIAATVDAAGMGYLVVADSLQQSGWSATVDGNPATLLPADNAMVAVPVGAGVHRVELSYTVPGQRTGALVTGGAFIVCLGIVALWWWRRRSDQSAEPAEL